jgi:flagellar L-ring protein precursor FlgH
MVVDVSNQHHNPGSLFSGRSMAGTLICDSRAYQINDMVIVRISENTTATNSATTETARKTDRSLGLPSLFGLETTDFPNLNPSIAPDSLLSTETDISHEGDGSTKRSGLFTGTVAARVTQVLPNGYLVIQGFKNTQVNGERGKLFLRGLVNPLMIDKAHTVSSNQVADLELFYGGRGIVGGSQKPGWLGRFVDAIWPF